MKKRFAEWWGKQPLTVISDPRTAAQAAWFAGFNYAGELEVRLQDLKLFHRDVDSNEESK